jgi:hypothetical protein
MEFITAIIIAGVFGAYFMIKDRKKKHKKTLIDKAIKEIKK